MLVNSSPERCWQLAAPDPCAARTVLTCLQCCPAPTAADFSRVHLAGGGWKKPIPEVFPRCHLFPATGVALLEAQTQARTKGVASLSLLFPSQNLSRALVQAMTQKQPLTFTVDAAADVRGSGEVSARLVKSGPQVFPQTSDIRRATSTPDIFPPPALPRWMFAWSWVSRSSFPAQGKGRWEGLWAQ